MKKQYDIFDLVKLIAALMIVALHTDLFPKVLQPWLSLAVPLFFIISSYLLFEKINKVEEKEKKEVVKKYVLRILKLYLFWFIVLLPYTIIVRKAWFNDSVIYGIGKTIYNILFSSTFKASWFLIATIEGTLLVFLLRKKNYKWQLVLFFIIYVLSQVFAGSSNKMLMFFEPEFTICHSLIYILIGKMFADNKINYHKKNYVIGSIIFAIILYVAYLLVKHYELYNYYVIFLPFLSVSLFGIFKNTDIKLKNSKMLRQFSSFIYPIHIPLIAVVNSIITKRITNGSLHGLVTYIIVVIIGIIGFVIIKRLEDKKYFKFLKYSY